MFTITKPSTKQELVEVLRVVWRRPITVPQLIETCRCSACFAKLGVQRWAVAWIRDEKVERSLRLCEACGLKAEAAIGKIIVKGQE